MIKKLFIFIFIFCFFLFPLYSWSTTIETSRGEQTLTLPEGMSFEEAYVYMSKMYLEERFDHEDLLEEVDKLTQSIDSYIEKNQALREKNTNIQEQYEELSNLYEEEARTVFFTPTLQVGLQQNLGKNTIQGHFGLGGRIYETFHANLLVSFPLSIGLMIGVEL